MSLAIKADDDTSGRRDMDPHGWLLAAQGRMGLLLMGAVLPKMFLLINLQ